MSAVSAPGSKSSKPVFLPPALTAAGGAGAGAACSVEIVPALKATKKPSGRPTKASKMAEKLAEQRHKIGAALTALVEADATKAEVAKYFRMRVEQLSEDAA